MNNNKKPTPLIPGISNKICPICGEVSYSRDGIHPQCAMIQADEPRKQQIMEDRKEAAKNKSKESENSEPRSWNKKCPKCGSELHVRRKECDCGHKFAGV